MRYIKILLVLALILVGALYGVTTVRDHLSGVEIPPEIRCDTDLIEISVADGEQALLAGVTATDAQDGDITHKIHIQGVSKLITDNTAKVSYIVFDSHGNFDTATRMVRYTDYSRPHITIDKPLIYREGESIKLLDRIRARDALDGDLTNSIRVSTLNATSDPDVWTVAVQVTNSMGDTTRLEIPIIIHTGLVVRPDVLLSDCLIYLDSGADFRAEDYLMAVSTPIGPGKVSDVIIAGRVDTAEPGTYFVYYRYPYGITTGLSVLTVVVR